MKDFLLRLQTQFQKYWQGLSGQQKVVITVLTLVILASIVALSFYAGRPDYVTLFSNLAPEDANGIMNKLKESKVMFQITDGGRTIRVPAKDVYETRISLAGQGLPQGGSVGFEIFDKSFFGMTEFNQRLNYQRALQGELERTIRQISSVDMARVHLVLPEKALFTEKEKEPTASVILKLKVGMQLEKSQIKAILNLVRTSVEGLKENNISIVDTNGGVLSRPSSGDDLSLASDALSTQFELKHAVEKNVEDQISGMLDKILGPGKAVVKVNVEMDFNKKEATEEIYTPVEGSKDGGIVRSKQNRMEYFKGTGGSTASGVPGVASNLGDVPGYQQSQASSGNSDYNKDESTINYEINKKVQHQVSTPGEVKKLSISVLLDGDLSPEMVATIKDAVSSGVGIDKARGDTIVVENLAFDKSFVEKEKKEMDVIARKEMMSGAFKTGSIIFVTLIVLLFFMSMVRHYSVMKKATNEIKRTQVIMPEVVPPAYTAGAAGMQSNLAAVGSAGLPADDAKAIERQIEALAKDKPQKLAEMLKDWMSQS